jgi:hypothetical protein
VTAIFFAALTACNTARKFSRWARYRWALIRHTPIPHERAPLDPDEARNLRVITRGWKQDPAPEPAYDRRRSS